MENEKKSFVSWIKAHRTELIIAGISITAIIAIILGIKNHKALEEAWTSLRKLVERRPETIPSVRTLPIEESAHVKDIVEISVISTDRMPHGVAEHLRNLPEGWKASTEKIATAAKHGYDLLPGQTWVQAYQTGGVAA